MREDELYDAFHSKGISAGNELLIYKQFCHDFIQAAKNSGFAIIGIEGFQLSNDGSVKPNLDEIADFSDIDNRNGFDEYIYACFRASSKFIERMMVNGTSDAFCFTLTEAENEQTTAS